MMNKPRVLLVGPVCNLSGYSEHARTLLDSLIEMEDTIDLYVQDTQWAASTRSSKYLEKYQRLMNKTAQVFDTRRDAEGRINIAGLFDCTYQVKPPNEFQQMSENDIGVTAALETTFAPPEWVSKCNMMKQIIVVSEHAKKNLKNTKDDNGTGISTPITVIPFGYNDATKPIDLYKDLDINTNFNFLSVLQMAPRKNFENMLRWFVEEFKDNQDVGLVIKSHMQNNSTLDFYGTKNRINAILDSVSKERQCKVYFMHGNFTEQEMLSLYNPKYIDCYITATHGEGFGIPLFNAACSGIPIIATNWSGHLDFLRAPSVNRTGKTKLKSHFLKTEYDLGTVKKEHIMPGLISEGCVWAYPKEESFRKNLRFIYKNKSSLLEDVENLQCYLKDKMSLSTISKKYREFTIDNLKNKMWSNKQIGEVVSV
jgi:glycosyltransferase involved in cell wall biosynthesis